MGLWQMEGCDFEALQVATDYGSLQQGDFLSCPDSKQAKNSEETQHLIKLENSWARKLVNLCRGFVFTRCHSMHWHSESAPGLLAVFALVSQICIVPVLVIV